MTDVRPHRVKERPEQSKSHFRPDIEGLRAFAVGTVILDHVFGWPHGGFLGVDVFFVISGFLITGLLLAEHQKTGSISFVDFYRRRLKRILPAATLVLVVTVIASRLILFSGLANAAAKDAVWSFFFAANWHFAAIGTDYFQSELPPSPLQHYWSLSVEEQFYLVWPWLLLGILALGARASIRRSRILVGVGVVAVVLTAASFTWALIAVADSPTSAYFSTFTRVWQLLAGALLAMAASRLRNLPAWLRPALGWAGLVLLLGSVYFVTPESGVPAPAAVPVVLGALLVIAAGVGASSHGYMFPLTNAAARFIGKISFSLYLWHWPVVVLLAAMMDESSLGYYLTALGLTLALSLWSFYLVEDFVRGSNFLEPHHKQRMPDEDYVFRVKLGWAGALASVTAALSAAAVMYVPNQVAPVALSSELDDATGDNGSVGSTLLERLQNKIDVSLSARDFPALRPGPEDVRALPVDRVDFMAEPCVTEAPAGCQPGDGSAGTIMMLGDSISQMWTYTVNKTAKPYGFAVEDASRSACPIIDARIDHETVDDCETYRADVLDRMEAERPDVVVIANLYNYITQFEDGAEGSDAEEEWQRGMEAVLARATRAAEHVVVISAPPTGADPLTCITKFSSPEDCVTQINDQWYAASTADRAAVEQFPAVTYVDASAWMCSEATNECPAFVDGMLMRIDVNHMTQAYAEFLSPLLNQQFVKADILPGRVRR